ncbi:major facilitator superfamily domain-containing protein [Fennellomyces sp. T-0311]|nr:major facilitator superfamily domain-containing protein [Fennellomyces sp. T-0311]
MFFKKGDPEKTNDIKGASVIKDDVGSITESGESYQVSDIPPELTEKELKRLLLKIDLRIIPYVSLLYLLSYLDRVNIGNAKIAGLMDDIDITESDYNWALSIFFIGYILFQVPANLMLKWLGPRLWIGIIAICWGTISAALSACKTGSHLLAARFFLGGVIYYLSIWYTRKQVALRVALFYASNTLAGAVGGLLAFGIMRMDGLQGLSGWQWIFIIEAIPTLICGVFNYWLLPDFPDKAKFLTEKERAFIVHQNQQDAGVASDTHFSWRQVVSVIFDWKTITFSLLYICAATPPYSLSMFMPSIVNGMGYHNIMAQVMTVPTYVCAFIWCIANSYDAGRRMERGYHIAVSAALSAIGYILLIALKDQRSDHLYAGAVIATTGAFGFVAIIISWFSNNYGGHTRRNVGIATITSVGNLSGVISGQVYRADDAPHYYRENLSPEEIQARTEGKTELGEKHPLFRYVT